MKTHQLDVKRVLQWEPFQDEGELRVLSDAIVFGRKEYECNHCREAIPVGAEHRSRREVFDGEMYGLRFCFKCCEAAISDDHDALENRCPKVFHSV